MKNSLFLIISSIIIFIIFSSNTAYADVDNSVYYAVSGNTLTIYDPTTNSINTQIQPFIINHLATCSGAIFLTYTVDNKVWLRVISSDDYHPIKDIQIPAYSVDNDIIVDSTGVYVYVLVDNNRVKRINWISEEIITSQITNVTAYSVSFTSNEQNILIGESNRIEIVDKNLTSLSLFNTTTDYAGKIRGDTARSSDGAYWKGVSTSPVNGFTSSSYSVYTTETSKVSDFDFLSHSENRNYDVVTTIETIDYQKVYYTYSDSNLVTVRNLNYYRHGIDPAVWSFAPVTNITTGSSGNNAVIVSNDGSRIYVASGNNNVIQIYSTNNTYALIGNITTPGIITKLYRGIKYGDTQITQFRVQTLFQTVGIDNANITVYDLNDNYVNSGITDDAGAFACWINPQSTYKIHVNKTSDQIDKWFTVQTSSTQYGLNILVSEILGVSSISDQFLNVTPQNNVVHYTIGSLNTGTNVGTFTTYYQDTGSNTNMITVSLYKNNSTLGGSPSLLAIQSYTVTNNNVSNVFTVNNAAGNSYYVKIDAAQNTGSNKTYYMPIAFAGPNVVIPGFALDWYWWLAFIPTVFLFAVGTATKKGMAGIIGMIWAYIANYWNWFSLYMPQWAMYIVITLGVLISIAVIIYEAERFRS